MESSAPFDEFQTQAQCGRGPGGWRGAARKVSFCGMIFALGSAVGLIALHTYDAALSRGGHHIWMYKSAVPLIAIGLSYLTLMASVRRTAAQRLLGVLVGLAFTLWGVEQYLSNAAAVAAIDDFVVLLFVFDLSLVIRENARKPSTGKTQT